MILVWCKYWISTTYPQFTLRVFPVLAARQNQLSSSKELSDQNAVRQSKSREDWTRILLAQVQRKSQPPSNPLTERQAPTLRFSNQAHAGGICELAAEKYENYAANSEIALLDHPR